jgi:energy-coupling factor transport system permease protein
VRHTTYRPEAWTAWDWAILLSAATPAAAFLIRVPGLNRESVFFYPYPALTWPGFDVVIGMAILGLLSPVLLMALTNEDFLAGVTSRLKARK